MEGFEDLISNHLELPLTEKLYELNVFGDSLCPLRIQREERRQKGYFNFEKYAYMTVNPGVLKVYSDNKTLDGHTLVGLAKLNEAEVLALRGIIKIVYATVSSLRDRLRKQEYAHTMRGVKRKIYAKDEPELRRSVRSKSLSPHFRIPPAKILRIEKQAKQEIETDGGSKNTETAYAR
jgi:hypothetical protein